MFTFKKYKIKWWSGSLSTAYKPAFKFTLWKRNKNHSHRILTLYKTIFFKSEVNVAVYLHKIEHTYID